MVFFEAVQALLNIDFQFFIDIVMNNLLWFFIFYALMHLFFDGKKVLYWFVLFCVLMWVAFDWEKLTGFAFTGASFLLVYYAAKLTGFILTETTPSLRKYGVLVSSLSFYVLVVLWAFFGGG
ncbi:Uncharacterised protein [uncultured archaeon]|nr:Uncharacterised protein [uncultured archaeon]